MSGSTIERRIPLLLNQEFLGVFDQGVETGPFGPRYHIVTGLRVLGPVDLAALQTALDEVVARHEALRTRLVRGDTPHYEVHCPAPVRLTVRDRSGGADRDSAVEQVLMDGESETIAVSAIPQLAATLTRFDETDGVLVVMAHHLSTDGFSMRIVMRDLVDRYAAACGSARPPLPEPGQVGDHAVAERAVAEAGGFADRKRWWAAHLDGATVQTWPVDHPRSEGRTPTTTGMVRFALDASTAKPLLDLARTGRGSPFMALMAAYAVTVRRLQGEDDITIQTFSLGRPPGYEEAVGPFFNYLPLRLDLAGATTFRDVLAAGRRAALLAYDNDMPGIADVVPSIMTQAMEDGRAPCGFQVVSLPYLLDGAAAGQATWTEIRERGRDQDLCTDIPDGALWTLTVDNDGGVTGQVAYKHNLFEPATVRGWVTEFCRVVAAVAVDPDVDLDVALRRSCARAT